MKKGFVIRGALTVIIFLTITSLLGPHWYNVLATLMCMGFGCIVHYLFGKHSPVKTLWKTLGCSESDYDFDYEFEDE